MQLLSPKGRGFIYLAFCAVSTRNLKRCDPLSRRIYDKNKKTILLASTLILNDLQNEARFTR